MAYYSVYSNQEPINFAPANEVEEILQNVRTILSTVKYSVPYDRNIGVDPRYIDDPHELSKMRMQVDIVDAIKNGEPRVRIDSIKYNEDESNGYISPIVRIFINE